LVQPGFISLLTEKIKPGGVLHLATDWEPYAQQMLELLEQAEGLVNENGSSNYWEHPKRPTTKFEQRGKKLGHGVWDLLFKKSVS
jgi:tRNA (guanine-N7-)-methyltransferase